MSYGAETKELKSRSEALFSKMEQLMVQGLVRGSCTHKTTKVAVLFEALCAQDPSFQNPHKSLVRPCTSLVRFFCKDVFSTI